LHQLHADWAERIVAEAGIRPGDLVLDVGAGYGALTAPLVAAGARVVAIELHAGRAEFLRARFKAAPVTVVQCDAAVLRFPRQPFKIVANPPFGISSAFLTSALRPNSALCSADVVLQRPVVRRYAEGSARGSARWLRTWSADRGLAIPRRAFTPPPRVDSAVLVIRRR
jgi:23S rRNA (adenine-N6)-dimethyltransferase